MIIRFYTVYAYPINMGGQKMEKRIHLLVFAGILAFCLVQHAQTENLLNSGNM